MRVKKIKILKIYNMQHKEINDTDHVQVTMRVDCEDGIHRTMTGLFTFEEWNAASESGYLEA